MKFLNWIKLLKYLCSAGRLFHTRTTRSVKKIFERVDAAMVREQFIHVTASVNVLHLLSLLV